MQAETDLTAAQLEDFDLVAEVKVTTNALLNPLILHKVLSFLPVPTLKSARLVCTVWDEVGATLLAKQGRLTFSTLSPPTPCNKELTAFNPKLAKNVQLLFATCSHSSVCKCSPNSTNLPPNFVQVLPEISGKLGTLEFFCVKAFQPMQEIWSAYQFQNLTQISILADGGCLDKKTPPSELAQYLVLPKLKVFSLEMWPICRKPVSRAAMSTISQKLVNSAPDLEEVNLTSNSCLDFTACGKLKKLRFRYHVGSKFKLEIGEMTKMLESCRNSVEILSLDYFGLNSHPIQVNFQFPNLTQLGLIAANVFIIQDSLNVTNLPKLARLSMSSTSTTFECDISAIFVHYEMRHVGITSLDLCCTHYPFGTENRDGENARKMVTLFPAVKELGLTLRIEVFMDYDQHFADLVETMRSFGEWELTRGEIEFEITSFPVSGINGHNECGSGLVIAVLRGMRGWRGLVNTSLQFIGDRSSPVNLRLLDEMRDALLACRTIRNVAFTGFLMNDETKNNFQTFITEHDLPVSVKD